MSSYSGPIQNLMQRLSKLPGVGMRSAERIAFHLLKQDAETALALADAIRDVKTRIRHCSVCYNLTEADPCAICTDAARDQSTVCVVEQPKDLLALEAAGTYRGVYHVLLGRVAPLDAEHPESLAIPGLMSRLEVGTIREIIMGTNPTVDGDTTALMLQNQIAEKYPQVKVTRLARGLPAGTNIEHANKNILSDALSGRQTM